MNWHRLFGIWMMDELSDQPFEVEIEKDLSVQKQLLDVIVLRKEGRITRRLPDGLDDLAEHNLISFKSHQDTFGPDALYELISHFVTYRKIVSLAPNSLLPMDRFRLVGVSARRPDTLIAAGPLVWEAPGIYRYDMGAEGELLQIRIVSLRELPLEEHNAMLHLFTDVRANVEYGRQHYRMRSERTSGLLMELLFGKRAREMMAYTMEDYDKYFREELIPNLPDWVKELVIQAATPEKRLQNLSLKERLKDLSPEERLQGLTQQQKRELLSKLQEETEQPDDLTSG